jgi:hypothetical protein
MKKKEWGGSGSGGWDLSDKPSRMKKINGEGAGVVGVVREWWVELKCPIIPNEKN